MATVKPKAIAPRARWHHDRQAGEAAKDLVEKESADEARDEADDGEDQGFLEDDPEQVSIGVAHGLERRVLAQVVGDVGREDLIDDDDSYNERDEHRGIKQDSDRTLALVVADGVGLKTLPR